MDATLYYQIFTLSQGQSKQQLLAKKSFLHLCDVLFRPLVDVFYRDYTSAWVPSLLPACDIMTRSRVLSSCRHWLRRLGEEVVDEVNLFNFLNPNLTFDGRGHGGLGTSAKHLQINWFLLDGSILYC